MKLPIFILTTIVAIALASSAIAGDYTVTQNTIQLRSNFHSNDVSMTVTGPEGFHFSQKGATLVSTSEMKAQKDGLYNFEFVETKVLGQQEVTDDFNGRGKAIQKIVESNVVSGHFRIKNGGIISSQLVEPNQ